MKEKRIILGIILIVLAFASLFLAVTPSLYSQNSLGRVNKEIDVNFSFLSNEKSEYVLLYFGYVGCTTVCVPSLKELSLIYNKLDQKKFSFYFVNLLENSEKETVNGFAKFFNNKFKGVYLNKEEINNVIETLKVKVLPSIMDKYEIDHSSFLYVLKRNQKSYKQIFVYTARPFDENMIASELNKIQG